MQNYNRDYMRFLEEFVEGPRSASIYLGGIDNDYLVLFFLENQWIETRSLVGQTMRYAQDCAENWVKGVIP